MTNRGKYVDRNPGLKAAGRVFEPSNQIGDLLKLHPREELAENTIKYSCKEKNEKIKLSGDLGHTAYLPQGSVGELMSPELKKTRFLTFRDKFLESMFFQKPQLGQVFPSGSKPDHLTNENTTYGCESNKSDNLYELVLPRKSPAQVNREYVEWHEKYIVSHNHYLPAEQVNRHYGGNFDRKASFGVVHNVDKVGKLVKRVLQDCDRLVVVGKAHKRFLDRTQAQLGQSIDRFELRMDPYITQGRPNKPDECNMQALMENRPKCEESSGIYPAIAHVNKLRRYLFNKIDFHMYDLKALLQRYDATNSGFITFESIFQAMRSLLIRPNEAKIRLAAKYFDFVVDKGLPTERVHLEKFWKMLHIQHPLPHIKQDINLPMLIDNKETTYRLLCQDLDKPLPDERKVYRKRSDEDRTRAGDLISPTIPLHFGLVPSDFELERPKEELRRIFKRLIGDDFDAIWEMARAKLNGAENCKISVIDLREAMNAYTKRKVLEQT